MHFLQTHASFQRTGRQLRRPDAGEHPPGQTLPGQLDGGLVEGLLDEPLQHPVVDQPAGQFGHRTPGKGGGSPSLVLDTGGGGDILLPLLGHLQRRPDGVIVSAGVRVRVLRALVGEEGEQALFDGVAVIVAEKIEFHGRGSPVDEMRETVAVPGVGDSDCRV